MGAPGASTDAIQHAIMPYAPANVIMVAQPTFAFGFRFCLSLLAFAFGFRIWLSLLVFAFGFRKWLSNLAFAIGFRIWLSHLAFACGFRIWLSLMAFAELHLRVILKGTVHAVPVCLFQSRMAFHWLILIYISDAEEDTFGRKIVPC